MMVGGWTGYPLVDPLESEYDDDEDVGRVCGWVGGTSCGDASLKQLQPLVPAGLLPNGRTLSISPKLFTNKTLLMIQ